MGFLFCTNSYVLYNTTMACEVGFAFHEPLCAMCFMFIGCLGEGLVLWGGLSGEGLPGCMWQAPFWVCECLPAEELFYFVLINWFDEAVCRDISLYHLSHYISLQSILGIFFHCSDWSLHLKKLCMEGH